MSREQSPEGANVAADLAQAFQDLSRGEQTATALENKLNDIESRLDELLSRVAEDERVIESKSSSSKLEQEPSGSE